MLNTRPRHLSNSLARLLVVAFVAFNLGAIVHAGKETPAKTEPSARAVQNQATAQEAPADGGITTNPNPSQPVAKDTDRNYTSEPEFYLTLMVAGMAIFTLFMQFLLLKKNTRVKSEDTFRAFGMTLIIMGTLFSLTAGFSAEQILPAVGLFGTIAGYLLGRGERKEREDHA